jgi:hypothetical protein
MLPELRQGCLYDLDDGFSGQPVPDGILPRPTFAVFRWSDRYFGASYADWLRFAETTSLAASSTDGPGWGDYRAETIVHLAGQMWLRDLDFGIDGLANFGSWGCGLGPALLPQLQGYGQRVDIDPVPPHFLIAMLVQFPMMQPAERDGEFVADLAPQRARLCKAQMVSICGGTAAHQAGL